MIILPYLTGVSSNASAESPITPSGLNTHISSPVSVGGKTQYDITGGTRTGANLFYSFGEFGVPNNTVANFLNNTGLATHNILGRVTGGNASQIFGTIQTTGFGNANLLLMNPAGVVFGPTASLNVGGSVTFTTADYLHFTDHGRFHAIPNTPSDALLSTAPVAAYGFLGSNPGAITVQGSQLTVPQGQAISFVGGNITIQNGTLGNGSVQPTHLLASSGRINMGTTQSPGEFLQDLTAAPNINGQSFRTLGSIHMASGSTVDFSKTGNGKVAIRGGQLSLEIQDAVLGTQDSHSAITVAANQDTILLAPGSSIVSQAFSADRGPGIQIVADQLQFISDGDPLAQIPTGHPVNISARTNGSGNAGDITLRTTSDLQLINMVQIESTSEATPDGTAASPILTPGNAGNVELTSAHGNIRMTGVNTWASSQTDNSSGKTGTVTALAPDGNIILDRAALFTRISSESRGGEVQIAAQNLLMNFGLLATDNRSPLRAGNVTATLSDTVMMKNSLIVAGSLSPFETQAGDISLTAKEIVVTQGSLVNNGTFTSGSGGHLTIVTDTLQITDGSRLDNGNSGRTTALGIGLNPDLIPKEIIPSGAGGTITVTRAGAPTRSVLIDGVGSAIESNSKGVGPGGNIFVSANSVILQNGGTLSAATSGTSPSAKGGSIIVEATDQIILTNGALITASSVVDPKTLNSGIANAGNISINAGNQLELRDGSAIKTTTESEQANGGNISIRAIELVRLVNKSEISTSVKGTAGSGGNIFIDPNIVIVQGSNVTAQAVGGAGGNISFVTPLFVADSSSVVSATSERGPSGTVTIQSPTSNLSGAVGQLVSKISQPQILLQNRCIALVGGQESTFTLAGRNTLPSEPGDWLSSPVLMEHWTGEDSEHASSPMVQRHKRGRLPTEAGDKTTTMVVSLRRLTPPGFLVREFPTGSTGCPS
ncbi:MAG: filamentous hemagglutinin N-terminal domain-containing protein [Nitrospira sp.]|nr:filamentous hemagglutinin N-terminal domain-containing protein [Nitrospira sp.]